MKNSFLLLMCLLWQLLQAQNVGINNNQPIHARLESNGTVGASAAMFGSNGYGLNISADFPEVGFNYFYNNGTKVIKAGYAAYMGMDPFNGEIYIGGFNSNQSAANFGDIAGAKECIRIKQNGNVGIGTTNPGYPLTVRSLFNGAGIVVQNATQSQQIGFWTATNAAYVQTWSNTDMFFSTNNGVGPRFTLLTTGNADLDQSLQVAKEINNPATGGANLAPIAYGRAASDGTIINATANVTVNKIGTGQYEVAIAGQPNMYLDNIFYYVFITTSAKTACSLIKANNTIEVNTWNYQVNYTNLICSGACLQSQVLNPLAQQKTDAEFSFVVYKY
jgi:hypothetical protein